MQNFTQCENKLILYITNGKHQTLISIAHHNIPLVSPPPLLVSVIPFTLIWTWWIWFWTSWPCNQTTRTIRFLLMLHKKAWHILQVLTWVFSDATKSNGCEEVNWKPCVLGIVPWEDRFKGILHCGIVKTLIQQMDAQMLRQFL